MDSKKLAALVKEAEEAYKQVRNEANSFQAETDSLLEGFSTRAKATYDRFKKLEKESSDLNAVLLGQEIRGQKSDPETVKKASDAEVECNKLRSAMHSIGAMAALASIHMERKVSQAERQYLDAFSSHKVFNEHAIYISSWNNGRIKPDIKAEINKRQENADKLKVELDNKKGMPKVLKDLATGKTASPDGGTIEGAQALITAAAKAYNVRQGICDQLLAEVEVIKAEEEALKLRKAATYDALSASSPELVHHLITPIMPIVNVEYYNDSTGNAGSAAELLVKRKARELEGK